MKLAIHGVLCGVGVTLPPLVLHADPVLILVNMGVLAVACMTYGWCVLGD